MDSGFIFFLAVVACGLLSIPVIIFFNAIRDYFEGRQRYPVALEKKAREHTHFLYQQALKAVPKPLEEDEMLRLVFGGSEQAKLIPDNLLYVMASVADEIFSEEHGRGPIPEPPAICNSVEGGRYRDMLARLTAHRDPKQTALTIGEAFDEIKFALPRCDEEGGFEISLETAVPNLNQLVDSVFTPFFMADNQFERLNKQLMTNIRAVNEKVPILPPEYKGEDVAYTYLKGTPLLQLFQTTVPFSIPQWVRFEHMWLMGGTGQGKSQTIQFMLMRDFPNVIKGEASVIVIDSQGDLIRRISRLKAIKDRLVLIDPTDIDFPVALSLFSMGKERLGTYSAFDRERLQNSLIELLSFVLGTLLASEMTAKQGTLFNFIIRAMLVIPDATIHTLVDILQPDGYEKYKEHIGKLSPTAQLFFRTEFQKDKQFADTKSQVLRRIYGILENQTFERMFSHPTAKLDLFAEMNAGKVICINTAKSLLQQSGTEIFGRFFIALIAQAVQERETLPEKERVPCFVYIDEFGDYAQNADTFITQLFQQARKYKIGMCVAHQSLTDLSSKTADVLATNTSIKFVGGVSYGDTVRLARELRVPPKFIEEQPKGTFAVFIRGLTKTALSLSIPFGVMEDAPTMGKKEFQAVRDAMRAKYATKKQEPPPPPPDTPPPRKEQAPEKRPVVAPKKNIDEIDTSAGKTW